MDAGVVGLRIASSVMGPLVKRLFVAEGPGAGLVERPVRVSGLVSFTGEKRALRERDLAGLAEELVRRALRDAGPHDAPSEGEAERAAARLCRTLHALGDITLSDVEAVSLGHTDFARALHAQASLTDPHLDATPGEDALYHRVLEAACLHILHFFTQRSPFVARTLVDQSRRLGDLVRLVDVLVARLPSQSAQDAAFEQQYARYIANRHRTLTIHGIDLQQAGDPRAEFGGEWPLETAYLSLEAAPAGRTGSPLPGDATGAAGTSAAAWADPQPVEQALAGQQRVLLRGLAGSGKTTLVQWLAVMTARQSELTGQLVHLMGRVPFVLPLRTLTRAGGVLPLPSGFLTAVGCPLAGAQPAGWPERVLAAGRGVLLVDGIDEVPEAERERTRDWLRELTTAYPDNLVLVTSRPSAVREEWLGRENFTELTLSPMRPADIDVFIDRWHTAAQAGADLAASLRTAVRSTAALARLATNPLMCGLICALHRERRGFLPRGRKALYDAALSMLLERRDRERAMYVHEGAVELDEESQIELLQKLAYWLIRNGRVELAQDDAVEMIERVLPSMPYAAGQGSAAELFRFLLVRSGLLREPAQGAVDFVHRTFQDYLGARAAVEERDFGVLVRHAHLDQWEDVVRMAVAHARPEERARLLRGLVERGDAEPEARTRLHLLATACLEHATKLDPAVREKVESRARELIPPRSTDEAEELAAVGPVVLELLPGPEALEEEEAQAVAHTVAQLGTDAALATLAAFRTRTESAVLWQLGDHWDRFDTDAYADEIISWLVDAPNALITVRSREELARWSALGGSARVRLNGDFTPDEILAAVPADKVELLGIARNPGLREVGFLRELRRVEEMHFFDCPRLEDLSALEELPLRSLDLEEVPELRTLGALTHLTALQFMRGVPWLGWGGLPQAERLETLRLPHEVLTLSGVAAYPHLRSLFLGPRRDTPLAAEAWDVLGHHPALRFLSLGAGLLGVSQRPPAPLPRLTGLLAADGWLPRPDDFPSLQHLTLDGPSDVDTASLAAWPHLRVLNIIRPGRPVDTTRLPPHLDVTVLPRPRGANAG